MIVYFDNGSNPFTSYFKRCGAKIETPYNNFFKVKVIKKIESIIGGNKIIYNEDILLSDDTIIIFDSNITVDFLLWIRRKTSRRIIFWYWNPVRKSLSPDKIPNGIEKWSYSKYDCEKYKLSYNTTFYFDCIDTSHKTVKNECAFFIGRDKGRLQEILDWRKQLESLNIECDFHLIQDRDIKDSIHESPLPYEKVISHIKTCSIIIDYYDDPMAGLSLRPMEALEFDKKLVTNNKTICTYGFYNSDNIYSCNEIDENIKQFLKKPVVKSEEEKQYYLFSNWIRRFEE